MTNLNLETIVILDFGGQYAHLIASRLRRLGAYAEIHTPEEFTLQQAKDPKVKGIILSGGPQSVFEDGSPHCDPALFDLGIPVLGICYGHQFLCQSMGGKVAPGDVKEFGKATLTHHQNCPLFADIPADSVFWMSHGDEVVELPAEFVEAAHTADCRNSSLFHPDKNLYGIQFHPEVTHSQYGQKLLENFLNITEVKREWSMEHFLELETAALKEKIGDKNVFIFVSGGVDSTVTFAFLAKILGKDRVKGLFVDTGLLRQDEVAYVEKSIRDIGADLTVLRKADVFLSKLAGVSEPEKKRTIIGNTFIEVQKEFFAANDLGDTWIMAQGTIYPDTIETGATKHANKIKTHHNRVPEIEALLKEGKFVEPISDLYKDEVRTLGELLGLPHELVWRHPFPGPGLGVRILGSSESASVDYTSTDDGFVVMPVKSVGVQGDFRTYKHPAVLLTDEKDLDVLQQQATNLINTNPEVNRAMRLIAGNFDGEITSAQMHEAYVTPERVKILQGADHHVTQTLQKQDLYSAVWQFPVVLTPLSINNVGTESVVLRPVDSIDAMSASVGQLPWEFFESVAEKILQDTAISAVFLDVTSKPPGTIEWE